MDNHSVVLCLVFLKSKKQPKKAVFSISERNTRFELATLSLGS